jgi:hypothetical protein
MIMNRVVSVASVASASAIASPLNASIKEWQPSAALSRCELVVDKLRNCVVCEGWVMDDAAASRTLDYFRLAASGAAPEDDEEFWLACEFLSSHGQSLDWIFYGDPGALICNAAAHSERAAAAS